MDAGSRSPVQPEARRKHTLELCFIAFLAIVAAAALVDALSYDFVSAMAPLSILVPLLILIGVQLLRTVRAGRMFAVRADLAAVATGRNREVNAVIGLIGCMLLLLGLILVAGHYAGMAVFMLLLLRVLARERSTLSLAITVCVTAAIYLLFEHVFRIELYVGLLSRFLSGYGG